MHLSRLLHPRRLFVAYVIFTPVAFFLLVMTDLFCSQNDGGEDSDTLLRLINQKKQWVDKVSEKLQLIERELRKKYPDEVDEILLQYRDDLPVIYVITPTYARLVQKAELVRLIQTFLHVRNFHWIVIEDSDHKTALVSKLLANSGLKYTHLNIKTPKELKLADDDPRWTQPRGVYQRNLALKWIRSNVDSHPAQPGVAYFADDDNVYSLQIFEEMRYTEKVSVWPVGLVGKLRYESPIVHKGKVTGWFTFWKPERAFASDMAGFALNVKLLFDHPETYFSNHAGVGNMESAFIRGFHLSLEDLEPKANNCSQILVWHTRTEIANIDNERKLKARGLPASNLTIEV